MGIYSTNRLSFIGAEPEFDLRPGSRFSGLSGLIEFCDIICERALLDDEISSILEGENENKEEKQLPAVVDQKNNDTEKADDKKSTLGNKIGASAQELIKKIQEVLSKISEAIQKAFNNATIKIQELVNADQKFVDTYKKYLLGEGEKNLEGFEGVENIGLLENIIGEKKYALPKAIDVVNQVLAKFTEATNKLQNASVEEADSIVAEYEKTLKDITVESSIEDNDKENNEEDNEKSLDEILDANVKFGKKGENGFIPNQSTLNIIANLLSNSKDFIANASNAQKTSETTFKKFEDNCKKVIKESNDEAAKARAKAEYDMCIKSTNKTSKLVSQTLRADIKSYSSIRKIWIVCGRYAAAKAGNK